MGSFFAICRYAPLSPDWGEVPNPDRSKIEVADSVHMSLHRQPLKEEGFWIQVEARTKQLPVQEVDSDAGLSVGEDISGKL